MTFYIRGRAILLALFVSIHALGAANAHSLPGTVLIFSQDESQLQVTVQFALEDLVIAFPAMASLDEASVPGDIPSTELEQLRAYFFDHIALQSNSVDVPMSLTHARLRSAENDHVGEFVQVVADLRVELPVSDKVPSLMLFYDAVMHEVRSHSAIVYWRDATDDLRALADFRYNTIDGLRHPILLDFQ